MSQSRNTLQEKLRKKLEAVKSEEPETVNRPGIAGDRIP
jgi:hypothetical protein